MKRIFVLVCGLAIASVVQAAESAPAAPAKTETTAELKQLVAPIALYPDALEEQILATSTYPDQVVDADRWMQGGPPIPKGRIGDTAVEEVVALDPIAIAVGAKDPADTYSTTFPLRENPISEGRYWLNGKANGLQWADIKTESGLAFGTQTGAVNFDDSTAVLVGSWGPNQSVQATVHTVNQRTDIFEEVELRLRTTISANRITGYEINFRCLYNQPGNQYIQMVGWDGGLGNFHYLPNYSVTSAFNGIRDGDVLKATIIGNAITVYINGVVAAEGTDSSWATGNPGMGFYISSGASGVNLSDYGFTDFTASDE